MKDLLFLCHRIPYPPNKGDKIRSYHLLKRLVENYRVHLGGFIDDPHDWRYVGDLEKICAETFFITLKPSVAKIKSLSGLLAGKALTLPYYYSPKLEKWVDGVVQRRGISRILVFSSSMAQYAFKHLGRGVRGVIDFVDVDSDKWRQYSETKSWPMSWLYQREYKKLLQFEGQAARAFDAGFFVSREEAELFKGLEPSAAGRVTYVENGVDTTFFTPEKDYPNPYQDDVKVLVFTGAMDYWANVEAVSWFAQEVFPKVFAKDRSVRFYIVGARPTEAVKQLAARDGIVVTGAVEDVRPYLAHARLAVAPLRIARGIQNKVLEAMAMAKAVISTPQAIAGIKVSPELDRLTVGDAESMVGCILACLANSEATQKRGELSRRCVVQRYSWGSKLEQLETIIEGNN